MKLMLCNLINFMSSIQKTEQKDDPKTGRQKKDKRYKQQRSPEYVNVNAYKHFLSVPSTNQDYIQWAFGLRSYKGSKTLKILNQVPNVYFKTIEGEKQKHSPADINTNVNLSNFAQLNQRLGSLPSAGLLQFQTGLRPDGQSQQIKQKQKKWKSYAKKDRKQTPRLINSQSLKKKVINVEQSVSAFDGRHKYPQFTEKIIAVRNYGQFRHMLKGQINLPSIGWQTNLRQY